MTKKFEFEEVQRQALPPDVCPGCGGEGQVHGLCPPTPDNPEGVCDDTCVYCGGSGRSFDFKGWGWFGKPYGAPVEKMWPLVMAPAGRKCGYCPETIQEGQDGFLLPLLGGDEPDVPYHRECFARSVGITR